jgi:hypothetical protein
MFERVVLGDLEELHPLVLRERGHHPALLREPVDERGHVAREKSLLDRVVEDLAEGEQEEVERAGFPRTSAYPASVLARSPCLLASHCRMASSTVTDVRATNVLPVAWVRISA